MAIKLIIDSASDISDKEAQELGLVMLPITILFNEEEYLDGVNLLPNQFYEKLINTKTLPKTSQINQFAFEEEFEKHTKNGDELIVITLSSKLSGTYNNAKNAAEKFKGKVFVVDSLNACTGERLLGLYALQLIKQGKTAREIFDELNKIKSKIRVVAMIGTLEFLKKGGRISTAAAFAGKLLAIKPIIEVINGEVKVTGKAIGNKSGFNLVTKTVLKCGGINFDMPFGAIWSGLDKTEINKYIQENASLWQNYDKKIPSYVLGGTIGTHIGPGAVGMAFFEK